MTAQQMLAMNVDKASIRDVRLRFVTDVNIAFELIKCAESRTGCERAEKVEAIGGVRNYLEDC
jgi:hypothetical protein